MQFPFHIRKSRLKSENFPNESDNSEAILDGEYRKLDSEEQQDPDELEIIDLDEEHKKEQESLTEAYQKIGLSYGQATEAEVKQAYYEKRQEIRSYSLKDENRILLDLKNAFELIMDYPEAFQKPGDMPKDPLPAEPVEDHNHEPVSEDVNKTSDELLSWDDLMDEIDSDYKSRKKRKTLKKFILMAAGVTLIMLIVSGFYEMQKIDSLSCELKDDEAVSFISQQKISMKHDQNVIIEQKNILQYAAGGDFYIPLFHLYLQKCNTVIEKGIATISVDSILFCRYKMTEDNQISYEPIADFQYRKNTQLDLEGTWAGVFSTSMENKNSNSAVIKIMKNEQGYLTGLCEIEADNGKKGIYTIDIEQVENTVDVNITGKEWIDKPTFFIMSDFIAYYDVQNEELLPSGKNDNIFTFSKEKEQ